MEKNDESDMAGAKSTLITTPRLAATTSDNLPLAKYHSFLDYPLEIRAMVYEDFFATESCESGKARGSLVSHLLGSVCQCVVLHLMTRNKALKEALEKNPEKTTRNLKGE